MALTIRKWTCTHVPVTHLRVDLPAEAIIDADDNPEPCLEPYRQGDRWIIDIDLATGKIADWSSGLAELCIKARDEGRYALLCDGAIVATYPGHYAPEISSYFGGDYVEITVGADGTIDNWPAADELDLSAFEDRL